MQQKGLPEEYKRGHMEFLGCKINLSARPLIPRPETEFWTAQAIDDLAKLNRKVRVLDIFSGSGCVGIAVAKKIPAAKIDFADIDQNAVKQIKINLKINSIKSSRAKVFRSDIFKEISANHSYDAILANPPYVDPAKITQVQKSVIDHEPRTALFGGKRGMEVIEKFLARAQKFLKPNGFIYMEFDPRQRKDIMKLIRDEKYSSFEFFKDQFRRWRFVKIIR